MANAQARPKPVLRLDYCKACGRCIGACVPECISPGTEINAASGLVPVAMHLEACNGCNLCVDACPEPYGLVTAALAQTLEVGAERRPLQAVPPAVEDIPEVRLGLAPGQPLIVKGTHASAIGALLAGCRHFFGYP